MTSTRKNELLLEYKAPDGSWSVVLQDDGRTGYAYLLASGDICADVWLYNRGKAPLAPPWLASGPDEAPYENPREYVAEAQLDPPSEKSALAVEWAAGHDARPAAIICLRGRPIGLLMPDQRPGWAVLAKKDGPLAKAMTASTLGNMLLQPKAD